MISDYDWFYFTPMSLYQSVIPSPLGDLVAIASDDHLLMLEFADSEELEGKVAKFTRSPFVILTKEGSAPEKMVQIPRTPRVLPTLRAEASSE
jgi:hypothetical protein